MKSLLVVLATASLTLQSPASVQTARHPAEDAFAAAVSSDRLRKDVRDLVALGARMGGTPSGHRAAEHVQRLFGDIGLPSRVERDPPLLAHWEDEWTVEIAPPGGRLESAWPYGFSPSVEPATGELLTVADLGAGAPDASWSNRIV